MTKISRFQKLSFFFRNWSASSPFFSLLISISFLGSIGFSSLAYAEANTSLPRYSFVEIGEEISGKNPISREKFLRWTLNNAGFSAKRFSGGREPFIDIKRNQKIFPFVASAYQAGALDKFVDSRKFLAKKKITRIEALEIIFTIEGISTFQKYQRKSKIKDLPINNKDKAIIITAEKLGYISKNKKNLVFPYGRFTENDTVKILQKISSSHQKNNQKNSEKTQRKKLTPLEKTQALILQKYLKKSEISEKKLEDEALTGMMKSLDDKYSVYMPPKTAKNFNNYIAGKSSEKTNDYVGIGIAILKSKKEGGGIIVTELFNGGAKQSGILVGDEITHVNNLNISDLSTPEIVSLIKGEINTSVLLTLKRGKKIFKKTVTRKKIDLSEYTGAMKTVVKNDITWVKFRAFQSTTAQDFKLALSNNLTKESKGLVIDLRYNSGGLLSAAQRMLGELLPENNVAVRLKNDEGEQIVKVKGSGKYTEIPLVVIQNEYSASASEIFAGAIKDYERGSIIGTQSFGKGVAQNLYSLSNGGQIKLTTNEFFTPLGNTVHQKGITPDISLSQQDDATLWKVVKRILK